MKLLNSTLVGISVMLTACQLGEPVNQEPAEPAMSSAMKRYKDVWDNKNPGQNEFYASFSYQPVKGLELEEGVSRRDPSQILKVGDTYYVYYTKVGSKHLTSGLPKS